MRIGELFILGFQGPVIPDWLKAFDQNYGLGGVILFDYSGQTKSYENNIYSPAQLKELCQSIHALSSKPLIFIDQEGGLVRRLKDKQGFAFLPSQKNFNLLPEEQKRDIAAISYKEMRTIGINFNLAPVIDADTNPENPDIGKVKRSYSASIQEIKDNVVIINEIAKRNDIGLCLKHYPGIGGARVNSHQDIMDLSETLDEDQVALFYELPPTLSGNSILLSHAYVKQWDAEYPLSISQKIIKTIRAQLPETLLISDDLQMQGLQKIMSSTEACIKGLEAGLDMFCIGNNLLNEESSMRDVAEALSNHVRANAILEKSIQASMSRVEKRKRQFIA